MPISAPPERIPEIEDYSNIDKLRLLGGVDPDEPIYRFFPLWFFEEALKMRQLVLVNPQMWEDPFEDLLEGVVLQHPRTFKQTPLQSFLRPAYAQCWSRTKESDTLLRAYSRVVKDHHHKRNTAPAEEGVRVRSTPRKLLAAMLIWQHSIPVMSCFVGEVRYGEGHAIQQHIVDLIGQHGPREIGRGQLRAELQLLKRQAFAHEAEVRMICVDDGRGDQQPFVQIPINPSKLFDEVTFDPRVMERSEREEQARRLGYTGPFGNSDLYRGYFTIANFPNGWKED
jgi:hypothetical protein